MPKQPTTMIPLLCNLCPKKPRFSDVSHLLTHISSKSHLSNRFKLQIRSQGEPEARNLLADFDSWYVSNGLEDLLSERLSAKEQKKSTKRDKNQHLSINPKLKSEMKAEMKAESNLKDENPIEQPLAATPLYRPPIPRMHSWSTDPYNTDFATLPTGSPWALNSVYETPTMRRNVPNFSRMETPKPSIIPRLIPTPAKLDDTEDEVEKDVSKLKGIYWPGMNLFDSATAEMKRMRNQKKDGTALQQMKLSSAGIEPNEWVFNADGGLRKVRDIFDDSNDSGPDGSITIPTPKKRRNRKGAMTDISANAPRPKTSTTRQLGKRAATKRKLKTRDLPQITHKKKARRPNPSLSRDIHFPPSNEEHGEFRLAMVGERQQLNIFRDVDASPARTESPLEDHRFDLSTGPTVVHGNLNDIVLRSPPPAYKPVPMRFGGKENSGPGQVTRRLMPNVSSDFHPDFFHSDSMNPLYIHSHAHAFSYGDRSIFQADNKPGFQTFNRDFKPLMMSDQFRRMNESQGLPQIPGSSMADNIRYGM